MSRFHPFVLPLDFEGLLECFCWCCVHVGVHVLCLLFLCGLVVYLLHEGAYPVGGLLVGD